jgi:cholesterol transport system auxiliary component
MKLAQYNLVSFRTISTIAILGLSMLGCSLLQPVKSANISTYALEVQFDSASEKTGDATLLVNTPVARPGFDTPRMMYLKKEHELEYFARNQWVDTPARMIAPLIRQALENSGHFKSVVAPRSAASTDLRLDTEIIRLQQEFFNKPSQIHLTVQAQLFDLKTGSVVATKAFDVLEPASSEDPYGGVIATHNAVKKVLLQIADFAAQNAKAGN